MSRAGTVRFERDPQGQLTIVLLVQGVPIARSPSPLSIAAEVAFRDLACLHFNESLVVSIPTNSATLARAAGAGTASQEEATTFELISACAW
ncbi:MAG: hypothetical protein V4631_13310 [Pseudomonadota bacterium]